MKAIKQRMSILIALTSMVLLVSFIFLIEGLVILMLDMRIVFALLLLIFVVSALLLILEYSRYIAAKLIIENEIMSIQVAKIEQSSYLTDTDIPLIDSMVFIISCFGILAGSKVIKFNTDGVRLKEVVIRHDSICIVYGNDKEGKTIRLVHGIIEKEELQEITERFHYETGIIPVINM